MQRARQRLYTLVRPRSFSLHVARSSTSSAASSSSSSSPPPPPSSTLPPLHGVRVLDLTRVLAGPYCTMMLGDFGADVIKIERPDGRGDDTRAWGPPFVGGDTLVHDDPATAANETAAATTTHGESAYYLAVNRNKRSVCVDITTHEGQDLLRGLAATADVLVENYKVGALSKYRLGYDDLSSLNPRLVYASISGYGQRGAWRDRPGYDMMAAALGGLVSITGEAGADREPVKVGVAVTDLFTGVFAQSAISAALLQRATTGRGQHVTASLFESQLATLANMGSNCLVGGVTSPPRLGSAHQNIVPYQIFATSDGHLAIGIGNDSQFRTFCRLLGREDLRDDARYTTNALRVQHRNALIPELAYSLAQRTTTEWEALLPWRQVPMAKINDVGEAFACAQSTALGMVQPVPHPTAGSINVCRAAVLTEGMDGTVARAPPLLGQHTDEVLRAELGLSVDEVAVLRARGVVA